jgi:hypothetical protein
MRGFLCPGNGNYWNTRHLRVSGNRSVEPDAGEHWQVIMEYREEGGAVNRVF